MYTKLHPRPGWEVFDICRYSATFERLFVPTVSLITRVKNSILLACVQSPSSQIEKVTDRPTQTPLCGFTFATQKPLIKASL